MPPKAKARAKAKAKAGVAALGRVLVGRRPATRGEEPLAQWGAGQEVALHAVPPMCLLPGTSLVVTKGDYYGADAKLAGEVVQLEAGHGETTVLLRATGTDHEGLLKMHTAQPLEPFRCHLCPPSCNREVTGDYKIHALRGRLLNSQGDEDWTSNLLPRVGRAVEAEDEMANLRRRAVELERETAPGPMGQDRTGGAAPREEDVGSSSEKKKKKKKKKEAKKEKAIAGGRYPALAVQKELSTIYEGTGLDPREKTRKRIQVRAQKLASRKKAKKDNDSGDSSSTSSSSPSQAEMTGVIVFCILPTRWLFYIV